MAYEEMFLLIIFEVSTMLSYVSLSFVTWRLVLLCLEVTWFFGWIPWGPPFVVSCLLQPMKIFCLRMPQHSMYEASVSTIIRASECGIPRHGSF